MLVVSSRMQFFARPRGDRGRHKSLSWLGPSVAFRVYVPSPNAPHIGRNAVDLPPNEGVVNVVSMDQADSLGAFRAKSASCLSQFCRCSCTLLTKVPLLCFAETRSPGYTPRMAGTTAYSFCVIG